MNALQRSFAGFCLAALTFVSAAARADFPPDYADLGWVRIDLLPAAVAGSPGTTLALRASLTNTTSSFLSFGVGSGNDAACVGNASRCVLSDFDLALRPIPFSLRPLESSGVIDVMSFVLNPSYAGPFPGVVNFWLGVGMGPPSSTTPLWGEALFSVTAVPAVPEPSTALLLTAAGLVLVGRRCGLAGGAREGRHSADARRMASG